MAQLSQTRILTVNTVVEKECTNAKGEKFTCWRIGCKEGIMFTVSTRTEGWKKFDVNQGTVVLVELFGKEKDGSIWWNASKIQDFTALDDQQQLRAQLKSMSSEIRNLSNLMQQIIAKQSTDSKNDGPF